MLIGQPRVAHNGLPLCSERCTYHDGKRCTLLGYEPRELCEPTVKALIDREKQRVYTAAETARSVLAYVESKWELDGFDGEDARASLLDALTNIIARKTP